MTDVMVEPDERGRISLARLPGQSAERYSARRLPDGTVVLRPAVLITEAELSAIVSSLTRRADRPTTPPRPISEVLDRLGRRSPSNEAIEAARRNVADRRAAGSRPATSVTADEIASLRSGRLA